MTTEKRKENGRRKSAEGGEWISFFTTFWETEAKNGKEKKDRLRAILFQFSFPSPCLFHSFSAVLNPSSQKPRGARFPSEGAQEASSLLFALDTTAMSSRTLPRNSVCNFSPLFFSNES
jgi:hypothetical protein